MVIGTTNITDDIDASHLTITVESTKGFPNEYGLLKIDDEIITYTSKTDINSLVVYVVLVVYQI